LKYHINLTPGSAAASVAAEAGSVAAASVAVAAARGRGRCCTRQQSAAASWLGSLTKVGSGVSAAPLDTEALVGDNVIPERKLMFNLQSSF
jgi:hypothetical protein